jgi:putative membrane protein
MFTLARLELRRFMRARLTRAAIVVIMLIPLLYGALYLWAFWDPYGQLKRIPVALVNEDQAVSVDGERFNAGKDLAESLIDRQVFGWQITNAAEAAKGLNDGRYHLVFTIPKDFSASLSSPSDPNNVPYRGQLRVVTNDATNYLSGMLARSAFTEIRAATSTKATMRYFDKIFISFNDMKKKTAEAASGAGQLAGGLGSAESGATQLDDGSGQIASGLDSAQAGSKKLTDGLTTLTTVAGQVDDGASKVAAGNRLLAAELTGVANKAEPLLREHADEIQTAASIIADGADTIAGRIDELSGLITTAVTQAENTQRSLVALGDANPALKDNSLYRSALDTANAAVRTAHSIQAKMPVNSAIFSDLKTKMHQVSTAARALAEKAPGLADDIAGARTQVNTLADGAEKLALGAHALYEGNATVTTKSKELALGLYRLSTGARQLDGGLSELEGGLAKLHNGADQLASGLTDGARAIPGYDPDERAQRSAVMGDPVELKRSAKNAAATYGVGFSPYFISLALWVGAMIAYMLLRPMNPRHLASGAPAWRVALAGWLPGFAVGLVQAGVLLGVLHLTLGLDPARPWTTLGLLVLTVATFTAILQLIGATLGGAGRVVALALLMLQLTSSGGTYPIETSPWFMRALHPYLPMTYVIQALRHTINGGAAGPVWQAIAMLVGFTGGAVGLTILVLSRARRLTPGKLHPVLQV